MLGIIKTTFEMRSPPQNAHQDIFTLSNHGSTNWIGPTVELH